MIWPLGEGELNQKPLVQWTQKLECVIYFSLWSGGPQ